MPGPPATSWCGSRQEWLDVIAGAVRIASAEGHFRKSVDPGAVRLRHLRHHAGRPLRVAAAAGSEGVGARAAGLLQSPGRGPRAPELRGPKGRSHVHGRGDRVPRMPRGPGRSAGLGPARHARARHGAAPRRMGAASGSSSRRHVTRPPLASAKAFAGRGRVRRPVPRPRRLRAWRWGGEGSAGPARARLGWTRRPDGRFAPSLLAAGFPSSPSTVRPTAAPMDAWLRPPISRSR